MPKTAAASVTSPSRDVAQAWSKPAALMRNVGIQNTSPPMAKV